MHRIPYLYRSFLQKSSIICGSFCKRDLQLKASYTSSPLCVRMLVRINVFMCMCVCACAWDRGRQRGSEGKCVSVWEREMACACVCMRVCARKYVRVFENWLCMPWLMHWCGLNDPYARHDSFIRTEGISGILSEKTQAYAWHDSLYMWHDSYRCDMTHSICDKTRPYGFHQSVPPVIWLICICDVTRPYVWLDPYVWHDPSKCVPNVAPMPILPQRWKLNASSTPHPIFAHAWHLKKGW